MKTDNRRYDIDWLRVIAIGLLLIYHTAIGFQPWGIFIGFITSKPSWEFIWAPMSMLNIWRIPLLFYVSGMGVFLAMRNRNLKQLFKERFERIGIPLIFGTFCVVPLHILLFQQYYQRPLNYMPQLGHLWFLANILAYVLIFTPLFYFLRRNDKLKAGFGLKKWLNSGLLMAAIFMLMIVEAVVFKPSPFELYAFTMHGFVLGLLAFVFGYCMMYAGNPFWHLLVKWRWLLFALAAGLFFSRMRMLLLPHPVYLSSVESNAWILALSAFAYKHLNKPSGVLQYLKEAAYPVYIVHMVFLFLGSYWLFPSGMNVVLKYFLTLFFTVACSLLCYAFIIRRIGVLRVLFGLKKTPPEKVSPS